MADSFYSKLRTHWLNELPFVAYRKPNESKVQAMLQKDQSLHECCDFNDTGFVFAPFSIQEKSYLLKSDESLVTQALETSGALDSFKLQEKQNKESHIHLVEKALQEIAATSLNKVVLARAIDADFSDSPIDAFLGLLQVYANAFCYCWYHPKVGLWMGATPELLIKVQGSIFETMALAGTLPYREENVVWGEKEKEEQSMVTKYISKQLDVLGVDYEVSKVETVKAGKLAHLRSKIKGKLQDESVGSLIGCLHPTPAVCGLPKDLALQFISSNENLNRSFYSGYLGELNFPGENGEKDSHLFVNLRCMEMAKNRTRLFVGGGITSHSIPEKEWEETCAKSETIAAIFKKNFL